MATSQFLADRAGELIAGGWLELLQREKGTNLFTLWPAQRCVLSLTSPTGTSCYFRLKIAIESPETAKVKPAPRVDQSSQKPDRRVVVCGVC